jgi:hypothetical protein
MYVGNVTAGWGARYLTVEVLLFLPMELLWLVLASTQARVASGRAVKQLWIVEG